MFRHVALGAAAFLAGSIGIASAAIVVNSGGAVSSVTNVSQNAASSITSAVSTAFADLPGAAVTVTVPTGTNSDGGPITLSRLISTTFSAESQCNGAGTGWCSIRFVAVGAGGTVIFNPIASPTADDFAFDTNVTGATDTDFWEAHAIQGSRRLTSGTWSIRVQRAIHATAGATNFRLDDWNFQVMVSP